MAGSQLPRHIKVAVARELGLNPYDLSNAEYRLVCQEANRRRRAGREEKPAPDCTEEEALPLREQLSLPFGS